MEQITLERGTLGEGQIKATVIEDAEMMDLDNSESP